MNRDEQEMALWREACMVAMSRCPSAAESADMADAMIEHFRLRYPPQPIAAAKVWYDEPPFVESGVVHPCWMQGDDHPVLVARTYDRWEYRAIEDPRWKPLAGRRVCPIVKPPEPTT